MQDLSGVYTTVGGFFPYGFIKLMIILALVIYVVFSFVILQQESLMSKVVNTKFSFILRTIAIGHLLAALFLLVLSFLII